MQPFDDIEAYNRKLLDAHKEKASELHYKKGIRISDLFKEDQAALYDLPGRKFRVCRYEHLKADGYDKALFYEDWAVLHFWGDEIKQHLPECIQTIKEMIFEKQIEKI